MTEEIWRDVKGYEGVYQVSDLGRVKSLENKVTDKNGRERILKERILKHVKTQKNGQETVCLYLSGKKERVLVQKLVAEAFLEKTSSTKDKIRHINGDATDNRLSNLIYGSKSDCSIDLYRNGGLSSSGKLYPNQVKEIRHLLRNTGMSQRAIASKYKVSQTTIRNIGNGKTFSWLDENDEWRDVT